MRTQLKNRPNAFVNGGGKKHPKELIQLPIKDIYFDIKLFFINQEKYHSQMTTNFKLI